MTFNPQGEPESENGHCPCRQWLRPRQLCKFNQRCDKEMTTPVPLDKLTASVERLRAHTSTLTLEAAALDMTYNSLRGALKNHLGPEGYAELMSAKHVVRAAGEKRTIARPDDAGVLTVQSMSREEGWSWRRITEHEPRPTEFHLNDGKVTMMDGGHSATIVIDPDGREFIQAFEFEKADLLRTTALRPNAPPIRFVEFHRSEWKRRYDQSVERNVEDVQRGEAAMQRKREPKAAQTLEQAAGVQPKDRTLPELENVKVGDMTPSEQNKVINKAVGKLTKELKSPKMQVAITGSTKAKSPSKKSRKSTSTKRSK